MFFFQSKAQNEVSVNVSYLFSTIRVFCHQSQHDFFVTVCRAYHFGDLLFVISEQFGTVMKKLYISDSGRDSKRNNHVIVKAI
jgi:hypothetical protein